MWSPAPFEKFTSKWDIRYPGLRRTNGIVISITCMRDSGMSIWPTHSSNCNRALVTDTLPLVVSFLLLHSLCRQTNHRSPDQPMYKLPLCSQLPVNMIESMSYRWASTGQKMWEHCIRGVLWETWSSLRCLYWQIASVWNWVPLVRHAPSWGMGPLSPSRTQNWRWHPSCTTCNVGKVPSSIGN